MLRTAKTYALRAERSRLFCVRGGVGVCSHAQSLIFVRKRHNSAEVTRVGVCGNRRNKAVVNFAGRTVKRNSVAFLKYFAGESKTLFLLFHLYVAATGNAARSHAARNYRRVRGLSAAHGKDTLRVLHTLDILGRSFKTDQNNLFALLTFRNSVLCSENNLSCRRTGGSRNTLTYYV